VPHKHPFITSLSFSLIRIGNERRDDKEIYFPDKGNTPPPARSNRNRWSRAYRNARAYAKRFWGISVFSWITPLCLNSFLGKRLTRNVRAFHFLSLSCRLALSSVGPANSRIFLDLPLIKIGTESRYTPCSPLSLLLLFLSISFAFSRHCHVERDNIIFSNFPAGTGSASLRRAGRGTPSGETGSGSPLWDPGIRCNYQLLLLPPCAGLCAWECAMRWNMQKSARTLTSRMYGLRNYRYVRRNGLKCPRKKLQAFRLKIRPSRMNATINEKKKTSRASGFRFRSWRVKTFFS